ncbi:MAG: hypothetical protein KAR06_04190 [Deltaproteobacteria bacterium]|nr:hypothetical protein [Deltaproteobacteria bacterium]
MTFKTYSKPHGRSMGEAVSITNDGIHIFVGKALRDKLPARDPVYATYHIDEKNDLFGIKIVKRDLRFAKATKFYKFNRESSMFACKTFVRALAGKIKKGVRYQATWDAKKKMIVVDLTGAK